MEKINKTLKYNKLFATYGALLSATQKEILNSYFCFDLSISEIADERNISRAAVEDALQKGCAKLEELESELGFIEKTQDILKITAKIKEINSNSQINEEIEKIERRLK